MKKKYIQIQQGQHLSDIYQIESNTILCKTLTGMGATYSEIKAHRDSIIIEPNQPAIIGKCQQHKEDNVFGVMHRVMTDDIIEYLERTIEEKKLIKILTTPESFCKVKQAFEEIEECIYVRCFLLMDECQKYIQDKDYREDITLPINDFFGFENKAMVSATPIIPSDPRFDKQDFSLVIVEPQFDFKQTISILHTNNVLEALKVYIPKIQEAQSEPRCLCFFINSTDMILQLIQKMGIANESSVFCAPKSVEKLKARGFKRAYDNWSIDRKRKFNFFTSRFYSAFDIELEEKPDIIFVSEPYFSEYTAIDPCTDIVQAIGRFRNGTSSRLHIVNTNSSFPIRTREGIIEYLKASENAYNIIKRFYDCASTIEARNAYKAALDTLPYNKMLTDGEKDYFSIDNYIDEQLVKSSYNNIELLLERYYSTPQLTVEQVARLYYKYGSKEKLELVNSTLSIREIRKRIVEILETLKDEPNTSIKQSHIDEMRAIDKFIVEAYESVGKEIIEVNKYVRKRINEAMILKKHRENITNPTLIQLIKNSFMVGQKYTRAYIKQELKRIYDLANVIPQKAITAQTIREFFTVEEKLIGRNKAFLILEPII